METGLSRSSPCSLSYALSCQTYSGSSQSTEASFGRISFLKAKGSAFSTVSPEAEVTANLYLWP